MEYKNIGSGATVFSGYAFKSESLKADSGIPVIKIGNLQNKSVNYSETQYIDEINISKKMNKFYLDDKDILIAMTGQGSVGRVSRLKKKYSHDKLLLNQRVGKFICDSSILNSDYLFYVLSSNYYQEVLFNLGTGSGQPNLSPKTILDVKIPFPSITLQNNIAVILNIIESKIINNTSINDNLLQQALCIYKAWFFDYLLSDGVRPESWHYTNIDNLSCLVSRGITPKYAEKSEQIVLNQKCIRDHTIDLTLARCHHPKQINEKWIKNGDLLINSTGTGTLGRVAQVWFNVNNMTVDSHITIVRPKEARLIGYLGFWGLTHEREIEAQHTGSTGQTELPRDRVKSMELTLPDNETLEKFNNIIVPITTTIVSNQEENSRLAALRDTLLPKLISGELDVSGLDL